jgi:hypothetical protein
MDIAWEATIPFYAKSVATKLEEMSKAFGFGISQEILNDHTQLAILRWQLSQALGSDNPVGTKALTKLFFAYLRDGRKFLYHKQAVDNLFSKLITEYDKRIKIVQFNDKEEIDIIEPKAANALISNFHFLGYGRDNSFHIGNRVGIGSFSPWDIKQAEPILEKMGLVPEDVLVLSRLLSIPGGNKIALSQFISQLFTWIKRNRKEIKAIVTYCNPNIGHYGTVYRGANFLPMCYEEHEFAAFLNGEHISPRQYQYTTGKDKVKKSPVPIPLLLYWYPLRGIKATQKIGYGNCKYPYPEDATHYLTKDPANKASLDNAIATLNRGEGVEFNPSKE